MKLLKSREALLQRSPAAWAQRFRWIKGNDGRVCLYSFDGYEFLREPHNCFSSQIVFRKSAQVGVTELLMTRSLHALDCLGLDVLYVLPTNDNVSALSAGRFQVAVDNSSRVSGIFSDVANVHHKRAGIANLYFHGSNSRSKMKSVPAALLALDEFDEMNAANVALARDRVKGQKRYWEFNVSTPTLPGMGISLEYDRSDKRHFEMPCPLCGEATHFVFDDLERFEEVFRVEEGVASIDCVRCGKRIEESAQREMVRSGIWRAHEPSRETVGFALTGLYSPTLGWNRLWTEYDRAKEDPDPKVLREWVNGSLGLPFVERGYQLSQDLLRRLAAEHHGPQGRTRQKVVAIGIDSGVRGHYMTVLGRSLDGKERTEMVRRVRSMDEIAAAVVEYEASSVVLDAQPNTEAARKLQVRLLEKGVECWLCYYSDSAKARTKRDDYHPDGPNIVANRTIVLSETINALGTGETLLPTDAPAEAFDHVHALRRVVDTDKSGNLVERWVNDGPDHFAHAINYARLALEQVTDHDLNLEDHRGGFAAEVESELQF